MAFAHARDSPFDSFIGVGTPSVGFDNSFRVGTSSKPSMPTPAYLRTNPIIDTYTPPAPFPVLFSPGGLPPYPVVPPLLSPDYFNFAASLHDEEQQHTTVGSSANPSAIKDDSATMPSATAPVAGPSASDKSGAPPTLGPWGFFSSGLGVADTGASSQRNKRHLFSAQSSYSDGLGDPDEEESDIAGSLKDSPANDLLSPTSHLVLSSPSSIESLSSTSTIASSVDNGYYTQSPASYSPPSSAGSLGLEAIKEDVIPDMSKRSPQDLKESAPSDNIARTQGSIPFLSPQQTLVLQEAHREAQRRAGRPVVAAASQLAGPSRPAPPAATTPHGLSPQVSDDRKAHPFVPPIDLRKSVTMPTVVASPFYSSAGSGQNYPSSDKATSTPQPYSILQGQMNPPQSRSHPVPSYMTRPSLPASSVFPSASAQQQSLRDTASLYDHPSFLHEMASPSQHQAAFVSHGSPFHAAGYLSDSHSNLSEPSSLVPPSHVLYHALEQRPRAPYTSMNLGIDTDLDLGSISPEAISPVLSDKQHTSAHPPTVLPQFASSVTSVAQLGAEQSDSSRRLAASPSARAGASPPTLAPSSNNIIPAETNKSPSATEALPGPTPPSPSIFRNSASTKLKQLGSFPADEAFATSLEQLKSCGDQKPPYLWWTLIRAAILGTPGGKLQMETLCANILEKFPYFGTAKEAKNWKSSIRSVIHTKPCFHKTEDKEGRVWWQVDVNVDPREQRRGMKKRSNSSSSGSAQAVPSSQRPNSTPSSHRTSMDKQYSDSFSSGVIKRPNMSVLAREHAQALAHRQAARNTEQGAGPIETSFDFEGVVDEDDEEEEEGDYYYSGNSSVMRTRAGEEPAQSRKRRRTNHF